MKIYKIARLKCDQCELAIINGIPAHEQGCPNREIDPRTGEFYARECKWCGSEHHNGSEFDFCDEGQTFSTDHLQSTNTHP